MTIKAFSEKYEIPYSIAYQASFAVKPVSTTFRDKDFPELELYLSVMDILKNRIQDKEKQIYDLRQLKSRVKWRWLNQ